MGIGLFADEYGGRSVRDWRCIGHGDDAIGRQYRLVFRVFCDAAVVDDAVVEAPDAQGPWGEPDCKIFTVDIYCRYLSKISLLQVRESFERDE